MVFVMVYNYMLYKLDLAFEVGPYILIPLPHFTKHKICPITWMVLLTYFWHEIIIKTSIHIQHTDCTKLKRRALGASYFL